MDNGASSYRRFPEREEEAFGEIVALYRQNLIFFIHRYVKDFDTAEDLAEDVFVELLVHPERFEGRSSLKTYLFSIARNKAVDYLRKHSRLSLASIDDAGDFADFLTLEEAVIKSERAKRLSEALDEIREEYRTALHLVYLEEMSYDEAGRIMKKSRKQIENLVYRGKKALRQRLGDEETI